VGGKSEAGRPLAEDDAGGCQTRGKGGVAVDATGGKRDNVRAVGGTKVAGEGDALLMEPSYQPVDDGAGLTG